MSHRGGPTGFLQLAEQGGGTVLRWAEYQGNNMFQTLGNLMLNPKAGLLILDFDTGVIRCRYLGLRYRTVSRVLLLGIMPHYYCAE